MCFYAFKNVLEPMGHLGANLIFFILTLNQVWRCIQGMMRSLVHSREADARHRRVTFAFAD